MQINPTNPIFADFHTNLQNTNIATTTEENKPEEINRKLLISMIALGTIGVASIGIGILGKTLKQKKMFSVPKTDFTMTAPELIKIKAEDYITKPKKQPRRVQKSFPTKDGRTMKIEEYRTGTLRECFDDAGNFLHRERYQEIKRPDGFSDKLSIMTLDNGESKKTFGVMKIFRGYEEEEIGLTKEYVKTAKGKWKLLRRDATFSDDMHGNVNKIVEHLADGTTQVTIIKKSYNTKEIKIYDRKGNIISSSFGFLQI